MARLGVIPGLAVAIFCASLMYGVETASAGAGGNMSCFSPNAGGTALTGEGVTYFRNFDTVLNEADRADVFLRLKYKSQTQTFRVRVNPPSGQPTISLVTDIAFVCDALDAVPRTPPADPNNPMDMGRTIQEAFGLDPATKLQLNDKSVKGTNRARVPGSDDDMDGFLDHISISDLTIFIE